MIEIDTGFNGGSRLINESLVTVLKRSSRDDTLDVLFSGCTSFTQIYFLDEYHRERALWMIEEAVDRRNGVEWQDELKAERFKKVSELKK